MLAEHRGRRRPRNGRRWPRRIVVVGDTINTASRLESKAPEGGVLIGAETRRSLPQGSIVEPIPGLRVKGKRDLLDAYLLHAAPIPS
jgi:adenylate cyclase